MRVFNSSISTHLLSEFIFSNLSLTEKNLSVPTLFAIETFKTFTKYNYSKTIKRIHFFFSNRHFSSISADTKNEEDSLRRNLFSLEKRIFFFFCQRRKPLN